MIRTDSKNNIVYLTLSNSLEIGITLKNYQFYGLDKIGYAIKRNYVKILHNGTWDYLLNHMCSESNS